MPKKLKHFRLSDESIATITKYQTDKKLDNMTEALEQILSGVQNSFLSPSEASGASAPFADQPNCEQRRIIDDIPNCIIPATHARGPKTIEIPSPLVCEVCQSIRRHFPAETLQTQPAAAEVSIPMTAPSESLARNQDPSNSTRNKAGMVWCPEGLWVFPEKCVSCRTRSYAVWFDCQKQKYAEKGREQQT